MFSESNRRFLGSRHVYFNEEEPESPAFIPDTPSDKNVNNLCVNSEDRNKYTSISPDVNSNTLCITSNDNCHDEPTLSYQDLTESFYRDLLNPNSTREQSPVECRVKANCLSCDNFQDIKPKRKVVDVFNPEFDQLSDEEHDDTCEEPQIKPKRKCVFSPDLEECPDEGFKNDSKISYSPPCHELVSVFPHPSLSDVIRPESAVSLVSQLSDQDILKTNVGSELSTLGVPPNEFHSKKQASPGPLVIEEQFGLNSMTEEKSCSSDASDNDLNASFIDNHVKNVKTYMETPNSSSNGTVHFFSKNSYAKRDLENPGILGDLKIENESHVTESVNCIIYHMNRQKGHVVSSKTLPTSILNKESCTEQQSQKIDIRVFISICDPTEKCTSFVEHLLLRLYEESQKDCDEMRCLVLSSPEMCSNLLSRISAINKLLKTWRPTPMKDQSKTCELRVVRLDAASASVPSESRRWTIKHLLKYNYSHEMRTMHAKALVTLGKMVANKKYSRGQIDQAERNVEKYKDRQLPSAEVPDDYFVFMGRKLLQRAHVIAGTPQSVKDTVRSSHYSTGFTDSRFSCLIVVYDSLETIPLDEYLLYSSLCDWLVVISDDIISVDGNIPALNKLPPPKHNSILFDLLQPSD